MNSLLRFFLIGILSAVVAISSFAGNDGGSGGGHENFNAFSLESNQCLNEALNLLENRIRNKTEAIPKNIGQPVLNEIDFYRQNWKSHILAIHHENFVTFNKNTPGDYELASTWTSLKPFSPIYLTREVELPLLGDPTAPLRIFTPRRWDGRCIEVEKAADLILQNIMVHLNGRTAVVRSQNRADEVRGECVIEALDRLQERAKMKNKHFPKILKDKLLHEIQFYRQNWKTHILATEQSGFIVINEKYPNNYDYANAWTFREPHAVIYLSKEAFRDYFLGQPNYQSDYITTFRCDTAFKAEELLLEEMLDHIIPLELSQDLSPDDVLYERAKIYPLADQLNATFQNVILSPRNEIDFERHPVGNPDFGGLKTESFLKVLEKLQQK